MVEASDSTLIRSTLAGNREDFSRLVVRYQDRVCGVVCRMTGDREAARDLTQEAFVRVWFSLKKYREKYKFSTWLFRIAVNLAVDHLRRRRRETVLPPEEIERQSEREVSSLPGSADQALLAKEKKQRLEKALRKLPPRYRAMLLLRYFEGLSYCEIARATGVPAGTVMSHLYRAKKMLREELGENDETV